MRVFISHSDRNRAEAEAVRTVLAAEGFQEVFLDFDKHSGIGVGEQWERRLYDELQSCVAVVLVVTPDWHASKWCWSEFTYARALGKHIFPLIFGPAPCPLVTPDLQHLDLMSGVDEGLKRLAADILTAMRDTRHAFRFPKDRSPFPGLLTFQEEDAAVYFGRDDEVRELLEELRARRVRGGERLILVLGASGSGKSSLLRAGVLPQLRLAPAEWLVLPPFLPRARPVEELARSLSIALGKRGEAGRLHAELLGEHYREVLRELSLASSANEAQILLSIDQGEELLHSSEPGEASRLWEILAHVLSPELSWLAVMTMRSDSLAELQRSDVLRHKPHAFSLPPLQLDRIASIVEGPAAVAGLAVDPALPEEMSRDACTEDALPLLAFALRELYAQSRAQGRLTIGGYRALGNPARGLSPLENAVRETADRVLQSVRPTKPQLHALREAFVPGLVRVNAEGDYVRRVADYDHLPAQAHPILNRLVDARLLISRGSAEGRQLEVAHEALLRTWPTLTRWLAEDQSQLRAFESFRRSAAEWSDASEELRPALLVHRGPRLRELNEIVVLPAFSRLSDPERTYLEDCNRDQQRRLGAGRRLRRVAVTTTLVVAVVVSALSGFWLREVNLREAQAQLAAARRLAALSTRSDAPRERTRLAIRSLGIVDTLEGRLALSAAAAGLGRLVTRLDFPVAPDPRLAFSRDGQHLVASVGSRLGVWDTTTWVALLSTSFKGDVKALQFSGDEQKLLVAVEGGRLVLLDTRAWTSAPGPSLDLPGGVRHVAAEHRSPRFYVLSESDELFVVDPQQRSVERKPPMPDEPLQFLNIMGSLTVLVRDGEAIDRHCLRAISVESRDVVARWRAGCDWKIDKVFPGFDWLLFTQYTDNAAGNNEIYVASKSSDSSKLLLETDDDPGGALSAKGWGYAVAETEASGCRIEVREHFESSPSGEITHPGSRCTGIALSPMRDFVAAATDTGIGIWRIEEMTGLSGRNEPVRGIALAGMDFELPRGDVLDPSTLVSGRPARKLLTRREASELLGAEWWRAIRVDDAFALVAREKQQDEQTFVDLAIVDSRSMRKTASLRSYVGRRYQPPFVVLEESGRLVLPTEEGDRLAAVALSGADGASPRTSTALAGQVRELLLTRDGTRIVAVTQGDRPTLHVLDADTLGTIRTLEVAPGRFVPARNAELFWVGVDGAGGTDAALETALPLTGETGSLTRPASVSDASQVVGVDRRSGMVVALGSQRTTEYGLPLVEVWDGLGRLVMQWNLTSEFVAFSRDYGWLAYRSSFGRLVALPLTAEGLLDMACGRLEDNLPLPARSDSEGPPEADEVAEVCRGRGAAASR